MHTIVIPSNQQMFARLNIGQKRFSFSSIIQINLEKKKGFQVILIQIDKIDEIDGWMDGSK